MDPQVWKASGHVDAFNDPLIDNKDSKKRYRADQLLEDHQEKIRDKIAKEIDIVSNSIVIDNLDPWGVKTLARLCKTGTCLQWLNASSSCVAELKSAGFQIDSTNA